MRNVTIRNSRLDGTNLAVRIKSMRGRGGGVEDVLYENLEGKATSGIQLTLNYHTGTPPTNNTATPVLRRITIRNITVKTSDSFLECQGLSDSIIQDISFEDVTITGSDKQSCAFCEIAATGGSSPLPGKGELI